MVWNTALHMALKDADNIEQCVKSHDTKRLQYG